MRRSGGRSRSSARVVVRDMSDGLARKRPLADLGTLPATSLGMKTIEIQKRVIRGGSTKRDLGIKTRFQWSKVKYDVFVNGKLVSPLDGIDSKRGAEAFAASL